eukprot:599955-Rhodomonas_salina.3
MHFKELGPSAKEDEGRPGPQIAQIQSWADLWYNLAWRSDLSAARSISELLSSRPESARHPTGPLPPERKSERKTQYPG